MDRLTPLVFAAVLLTGLPFAVSRAAPQESSTPWGVYTLVSIDGHMLPYAPQHPGRPADAPPPPQVVASRFTVNADSTFRLTMSYSMTVNGVAQARTGEFRGSYTREGTGYSFKWTNAGRTPVTMAGDTLVMNNEGMLFAYVHLPPR